jgi:flagellar basal-body rod protein FlgF
MDRSLYLAMNGAKQTLIAQTSNANNIANAQTTAFKSDFEQFRSMPSYGPGFPARAYSMSERPGSSFATGTLQRTGRELDVAIDGNGWIAVKGADGTEAYTRAGDLQINAQGTLQTGSGLTVLNDAGNPVVIPPTRKVIFGSDGTISTIAQGANPASTAILDKIKLVNPDAKNLEKKTDGLFHLIKPAPIQSDPAVKLVQGSLESSNVNIMSAMVNMIELSRNYEYQIKVMKTASDNDSASAQLLQLA